ncbi:MAG: VPLPA-CTERM sorting domain-containing protein, partial [Gemmobacter sp.]
LTFAALPKGAQVLTFVFEAVPGHGNGYSAGGNIVYKTAPYQWSAWEGIHLGTVSFGNYNVGTPITLTLKLGEDFAGFLNIGLYGTNNHPLNYTIGVPSNALPTPAPVPLPAGMLLLGTALGGLGFAARRRRKPADG